MLGRLISEDVFMVNLWNISQRGGGLGLISGFTIRPTLYTFQMFKHFGDQQVYATSGAGELHSPAGSHVGELRSIAGILS